MNILKSGLFILCLMLTSQIVCADIVRGKILQEQSCTTCHDSSVYTRPDRRIKTLDALKERVGRCTKAAGVKWNRQEVLDVVNYLNSSFYHYK